MNRRTVLAMCFVASIFGGCEYFNQVTIPESDDVNPLAIAGVYDVVAGEYVELGIGTKASYTVSDPEQTFLAVGATYDQGGARRVEIQGSWEWYCVRPGRLSPGWQDLEPRVEGQVGHAGDKVSNGVWTYYAVRFDQAPAKCDPGLSIQDLSFRWRVRAGDFARREASQTGTIRYVPRTSAQLSSKE